MPHSLLISKELSMAKIAYIKAKMGYELLLAFEPLSLCSLHKPAHAWPLDRSLPLIANIAPAARPPILFLPVAAALPLRLRRRSCALSTSQPSNPADPAIPIPTFGSKPSKLCLQEAVPRGAQAPHDFFSQNENDLSLSSPDVLGSDLKLIGVD